MARLKRKSIEVEKAKKRLSGLEAISATLDLGNGLTVANYIAKIAAVEVQLDAHNQLISLSDATTNEVDKLNKELALLSERMLEAVGAVFGHDSNEYEKAGGVRKSERKRPTRTKKAA